MDSRNGSRIGGKSIRNLITALTTTINLPHYSGYTHEGETQVNHEYKH